MSFGNVSDFRGIPTGPLMGPQQAKPSQAAEGVSQTSLPANGVEGKLSVKDRAKLYESQAPGASGKAVAGAAKELRNVGRPSDNAAGAAERLVRPKQTAAPAAAPSRPLPQTQSSKAEQTKVQDDVPPPLPPRDDHTISEELGAAPPVPPRENDKAPKRLPSSPPPPPPSTESAQTPAAPLAKQWPKAPPPPPPNTQSAQTKVEAGALQSPAQLPPPPQGQSSPSLQSDIIPDDLPPPPSPIAHVPAQPAAMAKTEGPKEKGVAAGEGEEEIEFEPDEEIVIYDEALGPPDSVASALTPSKPAMEEVPVAKAADLSQEAISARKNELKQIIADARGAGNVIDEAAKLKLQAAGEELISLAKKESQLSQTTQDKTESIRTEVNRQIGEIKGENKVFGREGPLTGIAISHNASKNTFTATLTFTTAIGTRKSEVLELSNLPPGTSKVDIIPVLHQQVNNMPVIRPDAKNLEFLEGKYTSTISADTSVFLVGQTRKCTAKQHELFQKHAVNLLKEGSETIKSEIGLKKFEQLKKEQRELTAMKNSMYAQQQVEKWRGSKQKQRLEEINGQLDNIKKYDLPGTMEEGLVANKRAIDAAAESHINALRVIGGLGGKVKSLQNLSAQCQQTEKQIIDANVQFNQLKNKTTTEDLLTLLIADKSSKEWTNGSFKIDGADFAQLFEGAQNVVTGIATPFITNVYKALQTEVKSNQILSKLAWHQIGGGILNPEQIAKNKELFKQYGETRNPKLTEQQIESLSQKHTQLITEYSTRSEKVVEFARALEAFCNELFP